MKTITRFITEEKGIQHAEEALLLALIAVALTGAAIALKNGIATEFSDATTAMASVNP